jgi:hypothetical protein
LLIGTQSGLLVVGGDVQWSGRGKWWPISDWNAGADVLCGDAAAQPAATGTGDSGYQGCVTNGELGTPALASDALDAALRSNLAKNMAARGPFSAYTYEYAPSVGACDPRLTEYVVVLTQVRE